MAYGRPVTERGSMSDWKTPMARPRSTRSKTRCSIPLQWDKRRKASPMFRTRSRKETGSRTCSRSKVVQLTLAGKDSRPATQVTLFDQGLVQMVQAAVTGLPPKQQFVLALADDPKGGGRLEPLAGFVTNPAGAAIVNTIGPIRQVTQSSGATPKR